MISLGGKAFGFALRLLTYNVKEIKGDLIT